MITLVRTILMRRKVYIKDHVSKLGVDGTVHSVDVGTRLAKVEDRLTELNRTLGKVLRIRPGMTSKHGSCHLERSERS